MKMIATIRLVRDDDGGMTVDEAHMTIDLTNITPQDNTNGLVARLRTLIRRELIARGLMIAEEEDKGKKRK